MKTLGERIKGLREGKGWSQKDLAEAAHVSQVTITHLEAGRNRSSKFLLEIASALEVDPQWLGTGAGDEGQDSPGQTQEKTSRAINRITAALKRAENEGRLSDDLTAAILKMIMAAAPQPEKDQDVDLSHSELESLYNKQAVIDNRENLQYEQQRLKKVQPKEQAKDSKNKKTY